MDTKITAGLVSRGMSYKHRELPGNVTSVVSHSFLDWLGVLVAGWEAPAVKALLDVLPRSNSRNSTLFVGSGEYGPFTDAALINGTAGHVLDFDDAHPESRIHGGAVLWPALLAAAETGRKTGAELVTAFVAGFETQARIAEIAGCGHYKNGWHSTATLGCFGAAFGAGLLLGLKHEELCHALGLAAAQAAGVRAVFGSPAKPLQVGRASANGLFSAALAQRRVTSIPDVFDRPDGYPAFSSGNADFGLTISDERWRVPDIKFKYYSSCYGTQAPIAAAFALRRKLGGAPAQGTVVVEIEPGYLSVCNIQEPTSSDAAKFSVRHTVALALSGYNLANERSFNPEHGENTEFRELRQRITVSADPTLARGQARLRFFPTSGADVESFVFEAGSNGQEEEASVRREQILKKSSFLLAPFLESQAVERIQELALSLEEADDVSGLCAEVGRIMQRRNVLAAGENRPA